MAYSTPEELKDKEAVPDDYSPEQLEEALALGAETIETVTGQIFEVREDTRLFDGSGTPRLDLDLPLLSLQKVEWLNFSAGGPFSDVTTQNQWRVYNRIPQDRKYPRIEIDGGRNSLQTGSLGVFPQGALNIQVTGLWGFVENTGTQAQPVYATPLQIAKACRILAVVYLGAAGDGSLLNALRMYGITEQETKHHRYKMAEGLSQGELTGIPVVDQILRRFMRSVRAQNV